VIALLDVNILIPIHRSDHPDHAVMMNYFEQLRRERLPFGVPELVLSSVVRIVTSASSFKPRLSTTDEAFNFAADILASPKCLLVRPAESHWRIFESLARRVRARGKLVPDAYLAALAIDQGFELITNDADFACFPGLIWRRPLESTSTTNPR
jgi:hypothetical protein